MFKKCFAKSFSGYRVPGVTTVKGLKERLDRLIEVAGSQNEFARAAGVSPAAVSNWRRDVTPFKSTLHDVADRLGVSLEWLTSGKGNSEAELGKFRIRVKTPGPNSASRSGMIAESAAGQDDNPQGSGTENTAAYLSLETITRIIREIRLNKQISAEERMRRVQPYQEEMERRLDLKS